MSQKIDAEAIKSSVNIADVVQTYVKLEPDGREFKACCPFHDEKTPSFTVVPDKGFGHCFGCSWHGDVIDFVRDITGCSFHEAVESLGGDKINAHQPVKKRAAAKRVDPYEGYSPTATDKRIKPGQSIDLINPKRDGRVWASCKPVLVHHYGGSDYVLRLEIDGKKQTPMVRWCAGPTGEGWTRYPFDEPRRLYGLESLEGNSKQVLVVEGEKARDYAEGNLDGQLVVVSWAGGTNGLDKTDWRPLKGRSVVLWPDADEPGFKAMRELRDILAPIAASIKTINPGQDAPKGWDVADREWQSSGELLAWCKGHIGSIDPEDDDQGEHDSPEPRVQEEPPVPPISVSAASDGEEWEEPIDIFGKLSPPSLDIELLPSSLRAFVQDQSELVGVDPGVIGLSAIITCAAAIDDEIEIQPKQHEYGWTESARLWGAIVGDPSIKKSPSIKKATSPLRKIDLELNEKNSFAIHGFKLDEKIYRKMEDEYIKDAMQAREAGMEPKTKRPDPLEHPECPRTVVEDATIEKLSEIMRYNKRGILCIRDELSGWFGAMDAYSGGKGGKDRPLWLEAYNGGPRNIDRIQRGSFIVPNWSISMIGGIQPDAMRDIASKTTDDGLLQRFMVVMAQDAPRGVDRTVNREAIEEYRDLINHLFSINPGSAPILLSLEAQAVRQRMDEQIKQFRAMGEVSKALMSHLAKWEGLFPRLLLTYYVIECATAREYPSGPIPGDIAETVYRFMLEYLFPHAAHFYIEVLDRSDHMTHARWIAELILSRQMPEISRRDIVAGYRAMRKQPSWVVTNAMNFLATSGWVLPSKQTNEGVTRWSVNPQVHVRFKALAEEERQRRAEARKSMLKIFEERRLEKNANSNINVLEKYHEK